MGLAQAIPLGIRKCPVALDAVLTRSPNVSRPPALLMPTCLEIRSLFSSLFAYTFGLADALPEEKQAGIRTWLVNRTKEIDGVVRYSRLPLSLIVPEKAFYLTFPSLALHRWVMCTPRSGFSRPCTKMEVITGTMALVCS
jgi:hypothetical protein